MNEFSPSYQDRLPREIYVLPYEKDGSAGSPGTTETAAGTLMANAGPETKRINDIMASDRKVELQNGHTANEMMEKSDGDGRGCVQVLLRTPQAVNPDDPTPRKFTFDGISPISSGTLKITATATTEESRDDRDDTEAGGEQQPAQTDGAQSEEDAEKVGGSDPQRNRPVSPSAARSPHLEEESSSRLLRKIMTASCRKNQSQDDTNNVVVLHPGHFGDADDVLGVKLLTEIPVSLVSPRGNNVTQRDQTTVTASEHDSINDESRADASASSTSGSWAKYFCVVDLDVLQPLRGSEVGDGEQDDFGKQVREVIAACGPSELLESSGTTQCVESHLEWIQEEVAEFMSDPKPVSSEDIRSELKHHLVSASRELYGENVPGSASSADPFEDFERKHYSLFLTESMLRERVAQSDRENAPEPILEEPHVEQPDNNEEKGSVMTDERTRRISAPKEIRRGDSLKAAVMSSPRKASFDLMTFSTAEEPRPVEKRDESTVAQAFATAQIDEDNARQENICEHSSERSDWLDAFRVELGMIVDGKTIPFGEAAVGPRSESKGLSLLSPDPALDSAFMNAPLLSDDANDDRISDIIVAELAAPRTVISPPADEIRPNHVASEMPNESDVEPAPESSAVPDLEASGRRLEGILATVSSVEASLRSSASEDATSYPSINRYIEMQTQMSGNNAKDVLKEEEPEGETAATELSSDGGSSTENAGSQTQLAWRTPVPSDMLYALDIDAAPSDELKSRRMLVPAALTKVASETVECLAQSDRVTISTVEATARASDPSFLFCEGFESLVDMCSTPVGQAKSGLSSLWKL